MAHPRPQPSYPRSPAQTRPRIYLSISISKALRGFDSYGGLENWAGPCSGPTAMMGDTHTQGQVTARMKQHRRPGPGCLQFVRIRTLACACGRITQIRPAAGRPGLRARRKNAGRSRSRSRSAAAGASTTRRRGRYLAGRTRRGSHPLSRARKVLASVRLQLSHRDAIGQTLSRARDSEDTAIL
ncbi:hypothetical protein GY45DRAFT_728270 [Cubamyces sp. BRFM 1775]|nr:hypothetical protein GY45DRAFT_728270 [Cubamyces sp. BRFM 1775]